MFYRWAGRRSVTAPEQAGPWWRLTWRVALTYEWGFPRADREQLVDVDTVAELRAVVLRARSDPAIAAYRYWRVREWIGGNPAHGCPEFIDGPPPARLSVRACRCGTDHRVEDCVRCSQLIWTPLVGPGCGPIPMPPDP
jgi:hypothetical protein